MRLGLESSVARFLDREWLTAAGNTFFSFRRWEGASRGGHGIPIAHATGMTNSHDLKSRRSPLQGNLIGLFSQQATRCYPDRIRLSMQ